MVAQVVPARYGVTWGVRMTGLECSGISSQQLALAVEHKGVDGGSQVHGCYSQVLSAGVQFSNVHDGSLHLLR